jgi:hypothetical protein
MKFWMMLAAAMITMGPIANANVTLSTDTASAPMELAKFRQYGFSSPTEMKSFLTIDKVQMAEIQLCLPGMVVRNCTLPATPIPGTLPPAPGTAGPGSGLPSEIIGVIANPANPEGWIALGMKAWQLIVANKPVANVSTQRISVLPMAQTDWAQMENWKGPAAQSFEVSATNLFGVKVISQIYTIAYNHSGRYNGKGHYLANATIIPTQVNVLWAFTLNSEAQIGTVVNTSSKDDPTPGVDLQVRWKMDSVLKHAEGVEAFFVKGDGTQVTVNH